MRDAAVIDMGSNSVRLLLVQSGRTEQFLETTRLGKGVEARRLQKEPMERTVQAVERFCALARSRGIERIHAFATSAVRDAENRGELLALLRERCGLAVDVLSGEEEADLAYLGAADGARALVLDIGGGSTELVFGEGTVRQAVSLQAGAVRLRERFGQDRAGAQAFRHDHDARRHGAAPGRLLRGEDQRLCAARAGRPRLGRPPLGPAGAGARLPRAGAEPRGHHRPRRADPGPGAGRLCA